jgi:pimeloyl-ACP methyl ester carboxylesterase
MSARELRLELPHLSVAARQWGPEDGPPTLALHGWLDNAATFDRLAPLLAQLRIVALDLPGHGRSDHWAAGHGHHFVDWAAETIAAADALGWRRFSLLGHSMGAGIASLVPAACPDRVERLVLIEGLGPLSDPPEKAPDGLAAALSQESRLELNSPRTFPSLDAAAEARRRDSDLDRDTARILVERGTVATDEGVVFTHDPRLRTRSRIRFTEDQVLAFLGRIRCPALLIRASEGWPVPEEVVARRTAVIPNAEVAVVPGGHHVHLTHPERVAPLIQGFLGG